MISETGECLRKILQTVPNFKGNIPKTRGYIKWGVRHISLIFHHFPENGRSTGVPCHRRDRAAPFRPPDEFRVGITADFIHIPQGDNSHRESYPGGYPPRISTADKIRRSHPMTETQDRSGKKKRGPAPENAGDEKKSPVRKKDVPKPKEGERSDIPKDYFEPDTGGEG